MAPPKSRVGDSKWRKQSSLVKFYEKYCNVNFLKSLFFDPEWLPFISVGIILAELVINVLVVHRIKYTEIDWIAYMQECEGFLNGTTNYALLRGDTGPLVYPAGFVYIYSALYYLTSHGQNIRLAQYVFIGIYLLQMGLVLRLYSKSRKVPPYVLIVSAFTSYRIHSIYVLRLFNDPIAVLFLYAALNLFLDRKWTLGSVFFSLGVSVKMNILLFAPAVFILYITNLGYVKTVKQLAVCAIVQLGLGAPFLLTYPIEYIHGSFDLGRVFEHKWTVNYRFLSREIFENKIFHIALLTLHIFLLIVFASPAFKYFQSYCRLRELQKQLQPQLDRKNTEAKKSKAKKEKKQNKQDEKMTKEQQDFLNSFEKSLQKNSNLSQKDINPKVEESRKEQESGKYSIDFDRCTQLAILPLFLSNYIGIICARSLHYQFYVWYFHTLPYLTWYTDFSVPMKFLILGMLEFCWNTYPSTDLSSIALHITHLILLVGIAKKFCKSNVEANQKVV